MNSKGPRMVREQIPLDHTILSENKADTTLLGTSVKSSYAVPPSNSSQKHNAISRLGSDKENRSMKVNFSKEEVAEILGVSSRSKDNMSGERSQTDLTNKPYKVRGKTVSIRDTVTVVGQDGHLSCQQTSEKEGGGKMNIPEGSQVKPKVRKLNNVVHYHHDSTKDEDCKVQ